MKIPPRLHAALTSNLTDAIGSQLLVGTLDLLAVVLLGFTAGQVGLLNAAGTISYLLLAVPFGILVDSRGPRAILAASLATKVTVAILAFTLLLRESLDVPTTMVLCLLAGTATVAAETSQTSLVAHLGVDSTQLPRSVAAMVSADRAAAIVAPAVIGFGVARGVGSALLGVAVGFLAFALIALARVGPLPRQHSGFDPALLERPPLRRRLGHGFRALAANRVLLGVTLLVMAGNIGLAVGSAVEAILIIRHLGLSPAFFGMLSTAGAAAGLAASLVAPGLAAGRPLPRVFLAGGAAQTAVSVLPLCAMAVPRWAPALMVLFSVGWAVAVTWCNIAAAAYTAAAVPAEELGRTSAASRVLTMGAVPLAALGGGLLADGFGLALPLILWPAITLLATVTFGLLSRPRGHDELLHR